jgi:hypothetical protein
VDGKSMKKIDIEVVDDFLSPRYFTRIKNVIMSDNQPWHFNGNISTKNQTKDVRSYGFHNHIVKERNMLVEEATSYLLSGLIHQAQDYCDRDNILRCRLDMVTRSSTEKYQHEPHVDFTPYKPNLISTIFYIMDSDAKTVIFNEKQRALDGNKTDWSDLELTVKKKILPKENRIVFFNGHYIHTGYSPVNYERRIVINTNYN